MPKERLAFIQSRMTPAWRSRSQSNVGFQSATARTRRGEPDRSCRLPSSPFGRARPVASLLVCDQAGCPFDETGGMPVLRPVQSYKNFRKLRKLSSIVVRTDKNSKFDGLASEIHWIVEATAADRSHSVNSIPS